MRICKPTILIDLLRKMKIPWNTAYIGASRTAFPTPFHVIRGSELSVAEMAE
jgi:hypothetical protein